VDIKKYIKRLQDLPYEHRMIILWVVVIIVALISLFIWVDVAARRLTSIKEELHKVQVPAIENPEIQSILEKANNENTNTEDKLLPNN
jgi:cytochrome c-type biogenesis protein CcmH/NrfF